MAPSVCSLPELPALEKGNKTMSDVINSVFGRPSTDTIQPGGPDLAVVHETVDTEAIENVTADRETAADVVEPDHAPVVAETDDVDQAAPVVEPVVEIVVEPVAETATAETRPAAGMRGSTTIGDGVVAKIVTMVAGRTDGVHSIDDEGISVEADDDIATIRISLVVEYGHPIMALAARVRTDVIEAVEQFFSLDVAAVDIHVSDIHQPAAD